MDPLMGAGGLSRGAVIAISASSSAAALVLVVVLAVCLYRRLAPRSDASDQLYYKFDYNSTSLHSVPPDAAPDAAPPPAPDAPLDAPVRPLAHPDRGEAPMAPYPAAAPLARSGSAASNISEDAIAAPRLSGEKTFGSGVGVLDERGNPVVVGAAENVAHGSGDLRLYRYDGPR